MCTLLLIKLVLNDEQWTHGNDVYSNKRVQESSCMHRTYWKSHLALDISLNRMRLQLSGDWPNEWDIRIALPIYRMCAEMSYHRSKYIFSILSHWLYRSINFDSNVNIGPGIYDTPTITRLYRSVFKLTFCTNLLRSCANRMHGTNVYHNVITAVINIFFFFALFHLPLHFMWVKR